MTPDEIRYLTASQQRVARPFHYRWALPALLGRDPRKWLAVQIVSLGALCALAGMYAGHWWAALLVLGCSGVLFNLKHPVLVDLPALALALGSAVAWNNGLWWLAIPLVLCAGAVKETSPAFAAAFAWHPILLVGFLPVAARQLTRAGPDPLDEKNQWILDHPVKAAVEFHRDLPLWIYVLPWGVLLAALTNPSPQLWVTLALAYGQLIVATDTVRLYQWALPVVVMAAAPALNGWVLLALVVHIVNPFRTEGI